jgi:hypothetical protein
MQDLPINSDDADWQQAPDGTCRMIPRGIPYPEPKHTTMPPPAQGDDASLTELFKQALKEQEQDYSQGKIPAPPVDETQDNSQAGLHKEPGLLK